MLGHVTSALVQQLYFLNAVHFNLLEKNFLILEFIFLYYVLWHISSSTSLIAPSLNLLIVNFDLLFSCASAYA